jgi:diphosphomevalonate decarboxylase
VEWHAGAQADGLDSFAEPLNYSWPELKLGILMISAEEKKLSSRDAMQRTVDTSLLYNAWPKKVARDLVMLRQALNNKNFDFLGGAAESNALSMHATMMSSWPPIFYSLPETVAAMHRVWHLRHEGLKLYFTQDAGPNLKLLFQEKDSEAVKAAFPNVEICDLKA